MLATTRITPEDIQYFIHKVCATPGKPVPFVPVIDANVRRWYKSDSLWQAHDDRYEPDQCLIIPGPEAVAGIRAANVPVAELLSAYLKNTEETVAPGGKLETPDLVDVALTASSCLFGTEDGPNPLPGSQCGARARRIERHKDGCPTENRSSTAPSWRRKAGLELCCGAVAPNALASARRLLEHHSKVLSAHHA